MERIFVDTGAWVALANAEDPDHEAVKDALGGWEGRLVTTNFVVGETITLALYRFDHGAATKLGKSLWSGVAADIVRVEVQDERDAWDLFQDRDDKKYSFVDCTSFIVMKRLKLMTACAVDDDFVQEGFHIVPPRMGGKKK